MRYGAEGIGLDSRRRRRDEPAPTVVPHDRMVKLGRMKGLPAVEVDGDAAGYFGFFAGNYGNTLHENLPTVAYMREVLPPHTKFLLADDAAGMMRKLIGFIDPTFESRIVWLKQLQPATVTGGGTLTISLSTNTSSGPESSGAYNHILVPYLRRWIAEQHPRSKNVPMNDGDRTVVFYSRAGTASERVLEKGHEQDVIASIERIKAEYGVANEVVVFTGHDPATGDLLSLEQQMNIFRRAKYIVGPHGSGLSNVIWTDPNPPSCEDRVKMLEFIPGTDSTQVQVLYNGYYWVLGGMPVEWSQILYAPNSTRHTSYVRIPELEDALRFMFGGEYGEGSVEQQQQQQQA